MWHFSRCKTPGTKDVNRLIEVNAPKNKKNAPAGESVIHRPKRRKQRLIRLDDLIPKENVVGGRFLFGAPVNPTQNNKT
jgi:hypothetical protein